jgi:hypothetical protein
MVGFISERGRWGRCEVEIMMSMFGNWKCTVYTYISVMVDMQL